MNYDHKDGILPPEVWITRGKINKQANVKIFRCQFRIFWSIKYGIESFVDVISLKTTIAGLKYSEIYLFICIFDLFTYSISRVDKNHDFLKINQKNLGFFI